MSAQPGWALPRQGTLSGEVTWLSVELEEGSEVGVWEQAPEPPDPL